MFPIRVRSRFFLRMENVCRATHYRRRPSTSGAIRPRLAAKIAALRLRSLQRHLKSERWKAFGTRRFVWGDIPNRSAGWMPAIPPFTSEIRK